MLRKSAEMFCQHCKKLYLAFHTGSRFCTSRCKLAYQYAWRKAEHDFSTGNTSKTSKTSQRATVPAASRTKPSVPYAYLAANKAVRETLPAHLEAWMQEDDGMNCDEVRGAISDLRDLPAVETKPALRKAIKLVKRIYPLAGDSLPELLAAARDGKKCALGQLRDYVSETDVHTKLLVLGRTGTTNYG